MEDGGRYSISGLKKGDSVTQRGMQRPALPPFRGTRSSSLSHFHTYESKYEGGGQAEHVVVVHACPCGHLDGIHHVFDVTHFDANGNEINDQPYDGVCLDAFVCQCVEDRSDKDTEQRQPRLRGRPPGLEPKRVEQRHKDRGACSDNDDRLDARETERLHIRPETEREEDRDEEEGLDLAPV